MGRRRGRFLLYACLVVVFGPSLFLSWRTYQLADRVTAVDRFAGEMSAQCEPADRALAATWSDSAARQIGQTTSAGCGDPARTASSGLDAPQRGSACASGEDTEALGDTYGVFTGQVDDACGLRQTALMTFRTTLMLTLVAVALAVMTLRREFD